MKNSVQRELLVHAVQGDSNARARSAILWRARGAGDTRCRRIERFPLNFLEL